MPRKKKTETIEQAPVVEAVQEPVIETQEIIEAPAMEVIEQGQEPVIETQEIVEAPAMEVIDPKKQILLEFKKYWEDNDLKHKSSASMQVGKDIWDFWAKYTGRPEKFNGCGSCLPGKITFLWREAAKYGITI